MSAETLPSRELAPLRVAVIGAHGRMGRFAADLLRSSAGFQLAGAFGREDPWKEEVAAGRVQIALDFTVAGLGFEHGMALLAAGVRPVVGTSGVTQAQVAVLDARANASALGGLVVPNFSLGAYLLLRAAEQIAAFMPNAEIVELHHAAKLDAPSATALETALRISRGVECALPATEQPVREAPPSRGLKVHGVPIHSVRLPGLYAHQEVIFAERGEVLTLRHDMQSNEAFGRGILLALRHAATAVGIQSGLDAVFLRHPRQDA